MKNSLLEYSQQAFLVFQGVFRVTIFRLSRRLDNVFKTSSQDDFKTFSTRLQDVFKTPRKTKKCYTEEVFKTFAGLFFLIFKSEKISK